MATDIEARNAEVERLMAESDKLLWHIANRYSTWFHPAEDLRQEGLTSAVAHWERFPESVKEDPAETQIFMKNQYKWAIQNAVINHFSMMSGIGSRHRQEAPEIRDIQETISLMDSEGSGERHQVLESGYDEERWIDNILVRQGLAHLDEKDRQLLLWFYQDELSLREIGHMTDTKRTTVWWQLEEARKKLRHWFVTCCLMSNPNLTVQVESG